MVADNRGLNVRDERVGVLRSDLTAVPFMRPSVKSRRAEVVKIEHLIFPQGVDEEEVTERTATDFRFRSGADRSPGLAEGGAAVRRFRPSSRKSSLASVIARTTRVGLPTAQFSL